MKKIVLIAVSSIVMHAGNGEELFRQYCTSCHVMDRTKINHDVMTAPGLWGIMEALDKKISQKEKIKLHIIDFVINPTKEKAICPSVGKYGLMPSFKGIPEGDLSSISNWMANNVKKYGQLHNKLKRKNGVHKNKM